MSFSPLFAALIYQFENGPTLKKFYTIFDLHFLVVPVQNHVSSTFGSDYKVGGYILPPPTKNLTYIKRPMKNRVKYFM